MEENVLDMTLAGSILDEYDSNSDNLIEILQKCQEEYGYLPEAVMNLVAGHLHVSQSYVMGVASFYSQFRFTPVGKYMIKLCTGTACHVNNADKIDKAIFEVLGIHDGETTGDGLFTLNHVACLGCCSLAPVMMINNETFGSLNREKTIRILKEYIKAEKENS